MSRKFALLGETLGHTMSPPIHESLFRLKGREWSYELVEAPREQLPEKVSYLNSLNGYNITIPHKMAVIDFLDELAPSAKRYNSVNCVDVKNGKTTGYNTDCDGFIRAVQALGADLGGKVLLVGCGGVGRMAAIESALAGADLTVAVLESDLPLAEQAKKEILALDPGAKMNIVLNGQIPRQDYGLLINATPVGMYPKTDACPVSKDVISCAEAAFDIIYNPGVTQLLKIAAEMGKKCSNGMSMLVWQAVKAHEIWDGDFYTDDEVGEIIDDMQRRIDKDPA